MVNQKMKNLLVTLADKKYINQAKQIFSSVYWNAGWKGDYMLLAHEVPEKDLKWFRDKGILIKKCKPLYNKKIWKFSPTVLSKFYLFTPDFKKWQNIIYLDADIIVRASLDNLTKIKKFAGGYLYKRDLKSMLIENYKEINKIKKKYNLKKPAFNSGVMAFNTDIIEESSFDKLIKLFKDYEKISTGDDPILNLFFYKKFEKLPVPFNILPEYPVKYENNLLDKIKGIIIHFRISKEKKPWSPKSLFYKEWKYNLDKADLINLNNRPKAIKKWSRLEIILYPLSIKLKIKFIELKIKLKIKFIELKHNINKQIGCIGIFLKKYFPKLYYAIK